MMILLGRTAAAAILGVNIVMSHAASADHLPEPQGKILLTVIGAISHANRQDGAAVFDRSLLEDIGTERVQTTTIWTQGIQTFTGVPLDALLDTVGAEGDTLRAVALNDYAIEISASDPVQGEAIIAYELGGAPMSVRDKGPLWIIYPYDSSPDYQTEQIYARSIWQLVSIEVHP